MAAPNRNQHWVPQFYLRCFATPETRDTNHPKIWSFPIRDGTEFCTGTRNVAAQRDLYAFCAPEVDKRLTQLESSIGKFWPMLTEDRYTLDLGFKRGVSLFIATLYMRHPTELERTRRHIASLAKVLEASRRDGQGRTTVSSVVVGGRTYDVDPAELDKYRTITVEGIKAAWGQAILTESGSLAKQLIDRPWTVLISEEPAFITTDHPVALHNSTRDDAPILNPNTTIYFPMSPTKLVLVNRKKENDGRIVQIAKGKEAVFNYAVFRSAFQHVFSAWDSVYVFHQIASFGDWARAEQRRLARKALERIEVSLGRNEPCYCGSGRKFKRCCGR